MLFVGNFVSEVKAPSDICMYDINRVTMHTHMYLQTNKSNMFIIRSFVLFLNLIVLQPQRAEIVFLD